MNDNTGTAADRIRQHLAALTPTLVELVDDSQRHAGHAGAASGGGHYNLRIASAQFDGLTALARHRLVYATLSPLMQREIHALSIIALTPDEASTQLPTA
ncbi:MAG: transcriptional regulator [Rhodocyclales bacterium]|nr:transcriptional regulator [Rhodocyclales bacterium]